MTIGKSLEESIYPEAVLSIHHPTETNCSRLTQAYAGTKLEKLTWKHRWKPRSLRHSNVAPDGLKRMNEGAVFFLRAKLLRLVVGQMKEKASWCGQYQRKIRKGRRHTGSEVSGALVSHSRGFRSSQQVASSGLQV